LLLVEAPEGIVESCWTVQVNPGLPTDIRNPGRSVRW
jgi:hypothetical protein